MLSPLHCWIDQGTELTSDLRLRTELGTRSPPLPQTSQGPSRPSKTWLVAFLRGVQRSTVPLQHPPLSNVQSKQPQDPTSLVASMGPIVQEVIWLDPSPISSRTQARRGVCLVPCSASAGRLGGACEAGGPAECDLLSSGWI